MTGGAWKAATRNGGQTDRSTSRIASRDSRTASPLVNHVGGWRWGGAVVRGAIGEHG